MRNLLSQQHVHPGIADKITNYHVDLIREVENAIHEHPVVVVGMGQNPFPRRARKLLQRLGIPFHTITIGSYFSLWRRRLALKMWTGWSTFPMIFVTGVFIGGFDELAGMSESGELKQLLSGGGSASPLS